MSNIARDASARRIMIIGSAGSGKSTCAQLIGDALDLPVIHIDREVFWLPGWGERDKADQLRRVKEIVAGDAWVFEGSNSRTFKLREARADLLIWLCPPLWLRLLRAARRTIRDRGKVRPDMADDCPERLDMLPGFLWFILSTDRSSKAKATAFFEQSKLPKHRFTRADEVNAYVAALKNARG